MVEEYLVAHHKTDILQILQDVDEKKHYSLNINFIELFEYDTNLGNELLKNPEDALEELDEWILYVQNMFVEQTADAALLTPKLHIHARVYGLPACPELHRNIFPKNEDLDLFLQVTGTVVRITATKMLEYQRPHICTKCKHVAMIEAVYDQKYIIVPPKKCLNPEVCPGKNIISVGDLNVDNCKDYQEVKIQEQSSKLGVGSMPASMWVTLEDDLVDACKPGDDVTICGIIKRRWGPLLPGKRIEVELVLKANHIQVNNGQFSPGLITPEIKEQFISFWEKYKNQPLEGRDLILKSFCPKLYGMYIVKLAMAVVLAGGTHCKQGNEVGIQIRSEPHIMLVGDPGTGKSQILRYAAKVIPRSVLTTGVGTTSAGLTVAAIMEDGQWQLEGGALVLADGGICCIDEFNSMKPHDRASIHEAMEQQTISVAKASMVCKLSTRCSILAATNPKGGHLDPSQPLSLNLALPSPLLSRFDVVLMLKDTYDVEWDNLVADYILSGKGMNAVKIDAGLWSLELLQQYYTIIRSLNPVLTPTTNKILSCYYQAQRRATFRNKARTTVRLLDSLVRLSQAHARLMFHQEVQVMDALFAVVLIENSMHGECAVLSMEKVNVQSPFVTNTMESYAQLAVSVLSKLKLHDILKDEIALLSNGYDYKVALDSGNQSMLNSSPVAGTSSAQFNESITATDTSPETRAEVVKGSTETIEEENVSDHKTDTSDNEPQIKSKFFGNKANTEDEKITKIENHDSAVKDKGKGKKRKHLKSHEESKQSKSAKNNSALNDFQMLNLIRSANDDFDLNVLNFMGDEDINVQNDIANNSESLVSLDEPIISQTTKVRQEIRKKFTFKPKIQPHLKRSIRSGCKDDDSEYLDVKNNRESSISAEAQSKAKLLQKNEISEETFLSKNAFLTEKHVSSHKSDSINKNCTSVYKKQQCTEEISKSKVLDQSTKLSQNTKFRDLDSLLNDAKNNPGSSRENEQIKDKLLQNVEVSEETFSSKNETIGSTTKNYAEVNKEKTEEEILKLPKCAPQGTVKLSQNTKSRLFREKFSFKPRNNPDLVFQKETNDKNCENKAAPLNITNSAKSILINDINPSQSLCSQSLFKSQDEEEDYDSLDF